ncbi:glycosyltransferase [Hamadaea tsunoensis]|uniref:glycosyltransferase n=1 Tax=Hamadaea tsunoensis TaxID=53368 RepID=UPI00040578AD|nr:glycosyltransferase [Hamadaea tsunoensis]
MAGPELLDARTSDDRRPAPAVVATPRCPPGGAKLFFLICLGLTAVGNAVFHAVTSRVLGPDAYGAVGSFLVVMAVLAVPATVAETLLTSAVARAYQAGRPIRVAPAVLRAAICGLVVGSAVFLCAPVLSSFLHLGSPASVWWLAAYCVPLALETVPWGVLCGRTRFGAAGLASLTGTLARLVIVVALAGFGVPGVIAAVVVADVIRLGLLWLYARRRPAAVAGPAETLDVPADRLLSGLAALGGGWLLLGADTMLARHWFTPTASGWYAAASTAAHGTFLLAGMVCLLAVPQFAAGSPVAARRTLRRTQARVVALGAAAALGLVVVGPLVVGAVFGTGFAASRTLLALLAVGTMGINAIWLQAQFQLARAGTGTLLPWLSLALIAVGAAVWHGTPTQLATVVAAGSWAGAAIALRYAWSAPVEAVRPPATAPATVDLTVVVPYYNPGDLLRPNVVNLLTSLGDSGVTFEVITVGDGCTDGSPATIDDLDPGLVRRISLSRNGGKGSALRTGLREGRGRYIGFIDADGDLDPLHWQTFLELIRLYRPDMVIGSKRHPLSEVDAYRGVARRLCSAGYQGLVRVLFPHLPVSDTQVGIKVFRRELLAEVLPRTVERGFVFDLELLVAARRGGYRRILAAPVSVRHNGRSTIRWHAVWHMAAGTLAIARRLYLEGRYDIPRPPAAERPAASPAPAEPPSAARPDLPMGTR